MTPTPLSPSLSSSLHTTFQDGFSQVYRHLLLSLTDSSYSHLASALEPTLYAKLDSDLSYLSRQGLTLHLVNPDAPVTFTLCNAIHKVGVPINRSDVREKGFYLISSQPSHLVDKKHVKMHILDIFNFREIPDFNSVIRLMKTEILQIDCLIRTSMKLIVKNASGEIVQNSDKIDQIEEHCLQFETYLTEKLQKFGIFSMPKDIEMKDWKWVLTDVDRELEGNKYKIVRDFS